MILDIAITSTCNLNCKHCYQGKQVKQERFVLPYYKIEEIVLDVMNEFKNNKIIITGGEPFTHPEINKILEFLKKRPEAKIVVMTNGTKLPEKAFELQNVEYSISLDGPKEVHEKIRGKGTYEKTLKNIQKIKEKTGAKVEVKTIITPELEKDAVLEKFLSDLVKVGVDELVFNNVFYQGNATNLKWVAETKQPLQKQRKPYCHAGEDRVAVNFDGVVYPCHFFRSINMLSMGNIYYTPLLEIIARGKRTVTDLLKREKHPLGCSARSFLANGIPDSPDPFEELATGRTVSPEKLEKARLLKA